MQIKNTSRYQTEAVEALVRFAANHFDTLAVGVVVKNATQQAYRGRAYMGKPALSTFKDDASVLWHVVVAIGDAKRFPATNRTLRTKWSPLSSDWVMHCMTSSAYRVAVKKQELFTKKTYYVLNASGKPYQATVDCHPYGGYSSPFTTYHNWKEAMVAVTAHELQHIQQFRNHLTASEVECETVAAKVLDHYRESGLIVNSVPQSAPACTTIADWIRDLAAQGLPKAEIARITGKPYQQVRAALLQGQKK